MYKIIEWNINQATDKFNRNVLPSFVGEYINFHQPDILVLTEFSFTNNATQFLMEYLDSHNYSYFPKSKTKNKENGQNEVLIGWRNDLFEVVENTLHSEIVTDTNNRPNYVRGYLRDKINNLEFYIAGLRITLKSAEDRRKQFEYILQDIEENTLDKNGSPIIITGDFNCYKRGYENEFWSLNEINNLTSDNKFQCMVPNGSSIYQKRSVNEFPEDLIIGKNITINNCYYDRGFTHLNPEIYMHGEDFSLYCRATNTTSWSIQFGSGIPDHAILVSEIEF